MSINPLNWNFNSFDYLTPTELRGGGRMPYQGSVNPFGNYASIGMSGIFNDSLSLCSFSDSFIAQTAPVIAQAKAYKEQMFNMSLYQAQQTSALRDQLKAAGINPDSVLNQNQAGANAQPSQLNSLLGLLGLGGAPSTNTGNSQLGSLLGLLGLGGGDASSGTGSANNQLGSLLSLLGGVGTTAKKPVDDWWNRKDDSDSSNRDESFWNYIDSKVSQSRQQSQLQSLLALLN